MIISKDRWNRTEKKYKKSINNKNLLYLRTNKKWIEVEIKNFEISPCDGETTINKPWEGSISKKPWEYKITAAIPLSRTNETIKYCVELLRLQTIKPYILLIDTGSNDKEIEELKKLRDKDLELHCISLNSVRHPSDYPAMAMDLAFVLCRSDYLFATHADCFLRRRNFLESMLKLCKEKSPAVGYQISPRSHEDWVGMISHTASIYDMKIMDKINFAWSLRKLCRQYDIEDYTPNPMSPNWPDTEILGNYILRENNIKPFLIGEEENNSRTIDENIDHFRSYTAAKMYSPKHYEKALNWFEDATNEAKKRIIKWKLEDQISLS